ncbi:MAG: glycosyltransferase family 4 protein, partial [Actinomycetota bacterium]|nr:glycosyltransferase family 4 protein [Actinomycetota bacterium]
MTRPRIALLRGHNANPWDLRPWEELVDRFDVVCLATGSNRYDLGSLRLPVRRVRALRDYLPRGEAGDLAVKGPGDRYLGLADALAGADLVHSAELGLWFSRQPALLKRRLGFKLVVTVWETIPLRRTYRTARGARFRAETLPEVDHYLAVTERARDCLLLEDVPPERIELAPAGIDRDRFARGSARELSEHVILSPGRLVWEKGHQDVLRALAALERGLVGGDPVRARLLVVGAGPERERLLRYAADLGLAARVELRSGVPYERMADVFAEASCVVLASLPIPLWEEQFGMVLAEALAADLPIVASASGAIPEVLAGNGALFEPGDWLG